MRAASISGPPAGRSTARPTAATPGRPSCATCRPCSPWKCKRCNDRPYHRREESPASHYANVRAELLAAPRANACEEPTMTHPDDSGATVRVTLPAHLRTLARLDGDVTLQVEGPVTQRAILDALEDRYPV